MMYSKIYLLAVFCALVNHFSVDGKKGDELVRKLSFEENPGCPVEESYCKNGTLIHIRSDSETDTVHFVWNFFGCPTLLLARTELGTNLSIDWGSFISGNPGSVAFDPPDTFYTFGSSLTTIWTFLDEKDAVEMDKVNASGVYGHDTKKMYWAKNETDSVVSEEFIRFSMVAKDYDRQTFGDGGYIRITVQVHNKEGYGTILPYLRHNGNASQVDISLNKVDLNNTMTPKTRIGLGYLLVQQVANLTGDISHDDRIYVQKTKTLDDENSPGVFEMHSIRTPVFNSYDQSYMEWKPVSYTGEIRDIADSVDVHIYDLADQSPIQLDDSFLYSFYGKDINTLIAQRANVSFGSQGDGFFNATPHISWSYLTGYGPPPSDTVSMLVIMTLAVGLGIPAIIILIAVIYLFTKKLSTPKDDLLLGR